MNRRRVKPKLKTPLTLLLAALLLVSTLGMTVPAARAEGGDDAPKGGSVTIAAFDALGKDVSEQTVPLGTAQKDLNLPGTLSATDEDGNPAAVAGVTWECKAPASGYDPDTPGEYTFAPKLPDGYTALAALLEITVTVEAPAQTGKPTPDPMEKEPTPTPTDVARLGGIVWMDADEDGVRDTDESGLFGFTVSLYSEGDLRSAVDTAKTGLDGSYAFTSIAPGRYVLGIQAQKIGGTEYLLPLSGYTGGNSFKIASDWVNAYTRAVDIQAGSDIQALDAGVRTPPQIRPMSFSGGAMVLTGVTAGNLQSMVDTDTDFISAGSNYADITSLTISGALNSTDTDFIKSTLISLVTLNMGGVTTTTFVDSAFQNCTSLVSVTLPAGCRVSAGMFEYCTGLKTVNNLDKAASFGNYAFRGCPGLESVTLPVGCNVSASMFEYCTGLKTVNNLDKAASFGDYAFRGCTGLESVTLPAGCAVSAYMFRGCTSLKTVNNLDKAASVDEYAFSGCTGLESVTLPAGFTALGQRVFGNCQNLEITLLSPSVVMVNATTNNGTFRNATNITVKVPDTLLGDYQADSDWQYWTDTVRNVTLSGITVQAAAFTTQPQNQTVTASGSVSFTVVVSGVPTPTLQWQKSTNNGTTWVSVSGETGNTLSLTNVLLTDNGMYRCVATGNVVSNAATLTVNARPAFTLPPQNQTVTAGQTAGFSVTASAGTAPYSYQWQVDTGGGFTDIGGAVLNAYTTPATTLAMNGYQYRCIVTDASNVSAASNAAKLTVLSTDASLVSVAGQPIMAGGQAGTAAAPKTASVTVPNGKASIGTADIAAATNATFHLYSDAGFSLNEDAPVSLSVGSNNHLYIKVTAQDATTVLYYDVTVARTDAPPSVNASINPTAASFDKHAGGDIAVTLMPGSYTLNSITYSSTTLVSGTDYTVSGNVYTIKAAYLKTLPTGQQVITFNMSGGTNPALTVTMSDSTPVTTAYAITVSANPTSGGSVTGGGNIAENTRHTVTATANSGYRFTGWTEGGAVVSTGASYTFTVTGSRGLVANFEPVSAPELTLSGIPKDKTITVGSKFTLTPSIDGGDWDWDGNYFSATFNSPATFTAKKAGTSTITYTADGQSVSVAITIKEATSLPQTGDNSNMMFWITLGLGSILAGLCLLVWRKWRDMGYIR